MSLTYPEAVVVGLVQDVTELFPVSSLGHSELLPALLGGRWAEDDRWLSGVRVRTGLVVGFAQTLALLPGISRSGAAMVAGLVRGLSHEDAARFSFLLATPVILAAGC